MNEDYCSYKLSLALKKCGFDWECDYYYNGHGTFYKYAPTDVVNRNTNGHHTPSCSAPTLWQAQKWLREKYNWHITVDAEYDCTWYYHLVPIGGATEEGKQGFESYEDALSAGIADVLSQLLDNEKE